jgi:hypothetical protein
MATLHDDADMAAQLERTLIGAYCGSADLGEALATAGRVAPGDYGQFDFVSRFRFTAAEGGGGHCEGMGEMLWQQAAFAWLSGALATGQAGNPGA